MHNLKKHFFFFLTLAKTGCALSVLLSNQSKKELWLTLMKNWDPPDWGLPVLAMERVPGALVMRWWSFPISSGMHPPALRLYMFPSHPLKAPPASGPPVPALGELAFLAFGQPNWFMKLGMTRWKCWSDKKKRHCKMWAQNQHDDPASSK